MCSEASSTRIISSTSSLGDLDIEYISSLGDLDTEYISSLGYLETEYISSLEDLDTLFVSRKLLNHDWKKNKMHLKKTPNLKPNLLAPRDWTLY